MICLTPKRSQSFFVYPKQMFLEKKSFLKKRENRGLYKKRKKAFKLLAAAIKKDPTTSVRKHADELKVHKKSVRTVIKQDLRPDLKPLDYHIWGVLEDKANTTSHPNMGSLKTDIEEECQKNLFWRGAYRFEGMLIQ